MKKKILSMVMAGAMALSVCSISQAAEISKGEDGKYAAGEIKVAGEFAVPTIKVSMDTSSKTLAINPYGLSASVTGVSGDALKEQLVNAVGTIENESDVALAVNATISATPDADSKSKATIATAEVKSTETKNAIFAYLQVDLGAAIDASATYNAKNANQAVFTTKATTKKAMVTLADTNGSDKKAAYKILGNVAANPTAMWTADDKVNFSIVYDFEPRVVAKTTTP